MQDILVALFHMIVFPGGAFALTLGLLLKGLDRKVEARLQRRVGPPIVQPFIDLVKLTTKETLIPATANRTFFLAAPLIGFTGMAVCAAFIPVPGVYDGMPGMGDMLVLFYLLPLPAIALMVGGSASSSPFGAIGFSREMTMMLAYEIPLLAVLLAVALKVGHATGVGAELSLASVVAYQASTGMLGLDPVMLPALLAYLLFLPGTAGVPPFDIPEAETEIIEGPLLEYSGPRSRLLPSRRGPEDRRRAGPWRGDVLPRHRPRRHRAQRAVVRRQVSGPHAAVADTGQGRHRPFPHRSGVHLLPQAAHPAGHGESRPGVAGLLGRPGNEPGQEARRTLPVVVPHQRRIM